MRDSVRQDPPETEKPVSDPRQICYNRRMTGHLPPLPPSLHEGDDLLILAKPAGLATHGGGSVPLRSTLLGRLQDHFQGTPTTPWLVHRLDRDTSGCIVVALTEKAKTEMEELFYAGTVKKEYLALVKGVFSGSGTIDIPLPGRAGKKVPALTRYRVERAFPASGVTLVACEPETGRMHQIRLHFARLHRPLVGDEIHGDFAFNKSFRKEFGLKRHFLHARRIAFPWRGRTISLTAPLPEDLKLVLEKLQAPEGG
jgi:RluA family pseudouridine synthase